ncbi:Hypothetical protein CINCED_3A008251 [Cinara cedri]|uniref:Uncharacterized protein n=1 Tax=Cinara cedri TaxID=506608 RepID=A0A5E4MDI1_9HEMI|nr:Hypothetical protein CINCED_3A008251 [Cinara cedri]
MLKLFKRLFDVQSKVTDNDNCEATKNDDRLLSFVDRHLMQTEKSFAAIGKAKADMHDDLNRLTQKVSRLEELLDKLEATNVRLAAKNRMLVAKKHDLVGVAAEHDRLSACLEREKIETDEIKTALSTAIATIHRVSVEHSS